MQIINSFDRRFNVMHSVVIKDNAIVFNVSYRSTMALPSQNVMKLYEEYLEERKSYG